MENQRRIEVGPDARVTVLRRHSGYAVVVVLDEGPFSHEEAVERASRYQPHVVTKAQAAAKLGISTQGVDYLRGQGVLEFTKTGGPKSQVLISADSVQREYERRHGQGT